MLYIRFITINHFQYTNHGLREIDMSVCGARASGIDSFNTQVAVPHAKWCKAIYRLSSGLKMSENSAHVENGPRHANEAFSLGQRLDPCQS